MKKLAMLLGALLCVGALAGCGHTHEWKEATCTEASICTACEEKQGEPLGHKWTEATCEAPKTCTVCGATEGEPLGHAVDNWETTAASSCSSEGERKGLCTRCNKSVVEKIEKLPHTAGEWETTDVNLSAKEITKTQKCKVCGSEMSKDTSKMTDAQAKDEYKKLCGTYSYKEIARNPESYKGKYAVFTGEVAQVMEDGTSIQLRVNVTKQRYFYDDTMYVVYDLPAGSPRILEDDIITMYGKLAGTISYETVMGATVTIPAIYAEYIDVK